MIILLCLTYVLGLQEKFCADLVYLGETTVATVNYKVKWISEIQDTNTVSKPGPSPTSLVKVQAKSTKTMTLSQPNNKSKKTAMISSKSSVRSTTTTTSSNCGCTRLTTRAFVRGDPVFTTVPFTTLMETLPLRSYNVKTKKFTSTVETVFSCIEAIPISAQTVVPILVKNCLHVERFITKTNTKIGIVHTEILKDKPSARIVEDQDMIVHDKVVHKDDNIKAKLPPFRNTKDHHQEACAADPQPPPFRSVDKVKNGQKKDSFDHATSAGQCPATECSVKPKNQNK